MATFGKRLAPAAETAALMPQSFSTRLLLPQSVELACKVTAIDPDGALVLTAEPVSAGTPSDPYLLTGFDQKRLRLAHESPGPVTLRIEIDPTGEGHWFPYRPFEVPPGTELHHEFPRAFDACWLRVVAESDTTATAQLTFD